MAERGLKGGSERAVTKVRREGQEPGAGNTAPQVYVPTSSHGAAPPSRALLARADLGKTQWLRAPPWVSLGDPKVPQALTLLGATGQEVPLLFLPGTLFPH